MIELLILTRFVADYLWAEKALSVVHALAGTLVLLLLWERRARQGFVLRLGAVDVAMLAFFGCAAVSFALNPSTAALIEFLKLCSYLAFYAVGRASASHLPHRRALALASLACLAVMVAAAVLGIGYQQWGDAITFAGGYFFKTDAALAAIVFMVFAFAGTDRRRIWLAVGLAGTYVVYATNARIALPLALVIPWLMYKTMHRGKTRIAAVVWERARQFSVVAVLIGVSLYLLSSRVEETALRLDLANLLSEENTQGRTVIWTALWDAYRAFGSDQQLFGGGLDADVVATMSFSASDELAGARAHGTLPYLLISLGLVGTAAFFILLYCSVRSWFTVVRTGSLPARRIAAAFGALLLVFLWISLTVEAIIRAQVCVPLFLLMGMVARDALALRRGPNLAIARVPAAPVGPAAGGVAGAFPWVTAMRSPAKPEHDFGAGPAAGMPSRAAANFDFEAREDRINSGFHPVDG